MGHHRHAVPLAPWQQVRLDVAIAEIIKDLIGRAAIAVWNTQEGLHVADLGVGHAPGVNLPGRAQAFERPHNAGELSVPSWPVQQVEIEMISAEPAEARLASTRNAVSPHMIGPHFGDQKYAVTLTGYHAADQFLGSAIAVNLGRIDQGHPERKSGAQRLLLSGVRMSPLPETGRALAQRRDNCSIRELYRGGRGTSRRTRSSHNHRADRRERRGKRDAKSVEFTSFQQLLVHASLLEAVG